jgi:hypothetical protein
LFFTTHKTVIEDCDRNGAHYHMPNPDLGGLYGRESGTRCHITVLLLLLLEA